MLEYSEIRKYPNKQSVKKKAYLVFTCPRCGKPVEKLKTANIKWLCKECVHSKPQSKVMAELKATYPEYDYTNTEYLGATTKIEAICPIHGSFQRLPSDFLDKRPNKGGCPKCGREARHKAITITAEEWAERLAKRTKDIKILSYDKVGYHEKVTLDCKRHGQFTTIFGTITGNKYVCPKCANHSHQTQSVRKHGSNKSAKVYYIYIPSIDMYKLGVTTKSRSSTLAGVHFETLVELELPMSTAVAFEHAVHTELAHLRYVGTRKLLRAGNTELYKTDIIEHINRISKGFIEGTLCRKESNSGELPPTTVEDNPERSL